MFLPFFLELKAAKNPVSLREYLTLLEGLDAGLVTYDVEGFYYLARSTLVKDERHMDRFDRVFGHVFKGLELLGGEEMLGRRAVTPEVAAKVKGIIQRTLDYAAEHNLDIMGANPAPDNIAGGLTTIEEKALGAIKKGGTRPLVEVLEEGERPTKKGFVIMDAPAPGVENLTAIVSGGCHAVIFSTGKGNCIGHPVAPVIKISGNPMTVKAMRDNIDADVSGVINQGLTLDQATDIVQDKLVDVCWGAMTSSDMLGEIETAASRLLRTL